ncbi:MAG TPA: serine/threonine-protein kinase, partial [Gemmatimonadaceae bacterium]|nr:serine/threonine-protein kinase [Gemmatimonadaceae bacterium]
DIPVAIKVLKPQYAGEESFEARFRREASTAAKLRHPNIVRILGVGREDDAVYFAMDYLPTGLDERLRIMGTLPEPFLIRLGIDVAAALAFAHREGVIHRDIKTDNILFDEHGNAVVADFGIARAISGYIEETRTNMVVGTPQYFSPEQARGQPLDGRADVYSLGVTLFRCATGVLPFQGDDWYDIARQHVEERPPRPGSFNPALSRETERVILKCLEKNPEDRYPTADALHVELAQLLGFPTPPEHELTVSLPTPTTGPRLVATTTARRHRRRVMLRWAVSAVVAVLSLVVFALSAARTRGHAPVATPTANADSLSPDTSGLATSAPTMAATDSTPLDSAARAQAARRHVGPILPPRVLSITAPPEAVVSIGGVRVGMGNWQSDTIRPGTYDITGSLRSISNCSSARETQRVQVTEHGTTEVTLAPRPCGWLQLDLGPKGVQYLVTALDGDTVTQSTVIPTNGVVLPVGRYGLSVSGRYCATYTSTIAIREGEVHHERARLFCNPPTR